VIKKIFLLLFISSLAAACGPKRPHAVVFPTPEIYRLKPGELILAALEDDIPPIQAEDAYFVPAEKADLDDLELVVGLFTGGKYRAYPVRLLSLHEVINDQVDDHYFAVTWCPLCFSAIVFNREVEGKILSFRASGYLLNDNLVLKDHPTDTLWSQLLGQGIKGARRGSVLEVYPSSLTTWKLWREAFPLTEVLSPAALGYSDEIYDPYTGYYSSGAAGFSSSAEWDSSLPGKTLIKGIVLGDHQLAIPVDMLRLKRIIQFMIDSRPLMAVHQESQEISHVFLREIDGAVLDFKLNESRDRLIDIQSGTIWDPVSGLGLEGPYQNEELILLPSQMTYWFAWSSFYPGSDLYQNP